jgi:predicted dehydrogenase
MIRVAVIGLGEAGATIHLPALRSVAGVTVVGAADPDENRRAAATARHPVPVFADSEAMLAATRPELVIVASPPALHAAHCRAALEAGADVLCEKPLMASVAEARDVLAFAAALGKRVSVNHEFRAMPVFRDCIAAVHADGDGAAMVQVWQLIDHRPSSESGWRGQLRRRSLYEAGVHLVDLALQVIGDTPRRVSATFSPGGGAEGADAISLVSLEFSRGRIAQLLQCRVHRGDRQYLELRADTRTGSYRASFGGRLRVSAGLLRSTRPHVAFDRGASGVAWLEHGASRTALARNGRTPLVTSTRAVIQACVDAMTTRAGVTSFPATDGLDTLRVVAAAYLASERGRSVELDGADADLIDRMPLAEVRS